MAPPRESLSRTAGAPPRVRVRHASGSPMAPASSCPLSSTSSRASSPIRWNKSPRRAIWLMTWPSSATLHAWR
eukprot:2116332-Pleurochrysis_carterae.AAC.1